MLLVFALSRWPGLMPMNFSAAYALAFCAGLYFSEDGVAGPDGGHVSRICCSMLTMTWSSNGRSWATTWVMPLDRPWAVDIAVYWSRLLSAAF